MGGQRTAKAGRKLKSTSVKSNVRELLQNRGESSASQVDRQVEASNSKQTIGNFNSNQTALRKSPAKYTTNLRKMHLSAKNKTAEETIAPPVKRGRQMTAEARSEMFEVETGDKMPEVNDQISGSDAILEMPSEENFETDGIRVTVDAADEDFIFSDDDCADEEPDEEMDASQYDNMRSERSDFANLDTLSNVQSEVNFNLTNYNRNVQLLRSNYRSARIEGPSTSGVQGQTPQLQITNEEEAVKLVCENPYLEKLFHRMIKEGIDEAATAKNSQKETTGKTTQCSHSQGKGTNKVVTPTRRPPQLVKSPSDTTLYAPALQKLPSSNDNNELVERILNFVEGIHLETQTQTKNGTPPTPQRGPIQQGPLEPTGESNVSGLPERQELSGELDGGREMARKIVLEAENFHSNVEPPPQGKQPIFNLLTGIDDREDDKYFHLTCHVDKLLKSKIENGEYVDLERLLPKRKFFKGGSDDSHLEWITRDGMTFLTPVQDRDQKISGIHKWDQAFHIYAAIYCNANPGRAGEVWQYIHLINTAATSYQWDNVAYYDNTFRQMMGECPMRSWAKTYTQLWQLALRDLITKSQNQPWQNTNNPSGSGSSGSTPKSGQPGKRKTWRDNCCWTFNRIGKCTRKDCHFDNRCSYCSAWNHYANICKKKAQSEKGSGSST